MEEKEQTGKCVNYHGNKNVVIMEKKVDFTRKLRWGIFSDVQKTCLKRSSAELVGSKNGREKMENGCHLNDRIVRVRINGEERKLSK